MNTSATGATARLLNQLRSHRPVAVRPYHYLIGAWVLAMISIPILRWVVGDAALRWGVIATVLLHAGAVLAILLDAWGAAATARVAAIVVALAWLLEYVGSSTGYPFGSYDYTEMIQPQLGHVPLLIPVAWLMMLPPAWAIGAALTARTQSAQSDGQSHGLAFVLLSALAFTAWDLFLDPQMVAWGLWVWEDAGGYFGIPWVNYLGWFLSAALITVIVKPNQLPQTPLLLIYAITWLLQTIGLWLFWDMPGPALVGFLGMGILLAAAGRRIVVNPGFS